jgi:hypothetical protein
MNNQTLDKTRLNIDFRIGSPYTWRPIFSFGYSSRFDSQAGFSFGS